MKAYTHLSVTRPQTRPETRPESPRSPFVSWPTESALIAEEVPVALEYNGICHAVMLATPADLEDFALGFSLSEGIVPSVAAVFDIRIAPAANGITVQLDIAQAAFASLKTRRRNLAGRTGCGLCGVASLDQMVRDVPALPKAASAFPLAALHEGIRRLPAEQVLQRATGAVHAACVVSMAGAIAHVREDVGRHNALDKTLGSLARAGLVAGLVAHSPQTEASPDGALLITSRASFEMVQKAAALGFGVLAAVSAPTTAAVRLAERLNLTLVGFLRDGQCAIYTYPDRLWAEARTEEFSHYEFR